MYLNSELLLCLVCVIFPSAISVSHVPVLLWSTESSMWNSAQAGNNGHITSKHELQTLLRSATTSTPMNVIMFLQDTLSIDDFTYYSTVSGSENPLHNVQGILDSSPYSLVLPAVDWKTADNLPDYLRTQEDWNVISVDNYNTSLKLDKSKPNLILVTLQPIPRSNEKDATEAFSKNDEQIGRLNKELMERGGSFTAIYTGRRPSKVFKTFDQAPTLGRQLLSTDTTAPYPPLNVTNENGTTCILIYAKTFSLKSNSTKTFDLTNATFISQTAQTNSSVCSASNTTLSLLYMSPGNGLSSLEIRFYMTNKFYTGSARDWFKLEQVMIIPNQEMEKNATFRTTYASAPAEYSYHCQQVGTSSLHAEIFVPNNEAAKYWEIFLYEFQIQGFHIKNNLFSYASDCSSFFTPAIWMGLVSSIILLWILSYGLFMIMQLTTNDRFDDPKGKPLSVPQTE
ncbi:V-type proton ATPase subunit S1-like [Spea bombifrons]|uniref:V-type proton ATPase subunit S1-like n=1 Tax=Spea bombifrons TaxID=233779 RepID=UPI00234ABB39|nr:V-type proton ATPase subunit S1-like [Spea bombifrons]